MAVYTKDGLVAGTEGRTVLLTENYSYWGDGDGTYYLTAVVATGEGFTSISAGESVWNGTGGRPHYHGSEVDAPQALIDRYNIWKQEQREKEDREAFNDPLTSNRFAAYGFDTGKLAYVEKGPRKRKNAGKWGHIVWIGTDRYNNEKCGIKNPETEEVVWVPTYQVAIIPEFDDLFLDNTEAVA